MIRRRKIIGLSIIVVLALAVIAGLVSFTIYTLNPPDENRMKTYFIQDYDDIITVAEYLNNSFYSSVYISKSNIIKGQMFTGINTRHVKIEDKEISKVLQRLMIKRGYRYIGKSDNTIRFTQWAFGDEERGIAYSVNAEEKPTVQYLTKLEPLSEAGWYYYEADYNVWRINQDIKD